ncbi:MAG: hypothetical protein ACOYKR_08375 [Sphingobacterium thalpophilum]
MMLKDGKFIRELPPVIGGNYFKTENREYSEEELEWQETLLAAEELKNAVSLEETILWIFLSIPVVLLVFLLLIGVFNDT